MAHNMRKYHRATFSAQIFTFPSQMTSQTTEVDITISFKTRPSLDKVKAIHYYKGLNRIPKLRQDLELGR